MNNAELVEAALGCQQRGNACFAESRYVEAKREYTSGLKLLDDVREPDAALTAELLSVRVFLLSNRALCQKSTHHYESGLDDVHAALTIAPHRAKVHAIKGALFVAMENYGEAVAALQTARALDPSMAEIDSKLAEARALVAAHGPNPLEHRIQRAEAQLIAAAMEGDLAKIEVALTHGAAIDCFASSVDPSNATALIIGAQEDNLAVVSLALAHGAKVDAKDKHGRTALWYSAHTDSEPVAAALMAAGANPRAADNAGSTPLDIAEAKLAREGSSVVICVLEESGVTRDEARQAEAAARLQRANAAPGMFYWLTAGIVVASLGAMAGLHLFRARR